jgi:hypothetical protein
MIKAKLVVVGGADATKEVDLELPAVFGRGREATVMLPHPLVSRRHCEVYEFEGRLMVRDLGSTNGTFVGSQRVTETVLGPGELLTIGTVTFRAVYGEFVVTSGEKTPCDIPDRDVAAGDTEKVASQEGGDSRDASTCFSRHDPAEKKELRGPVHGTSMSDNRVEPTRTTAPNATRKR